MLALRRLTNGPGLGGLGREGSSGGVCLGVVHFLGVTFLGLVGWGRQHSGVALGLGRGSAPVGSRGVITVWSDGWKCDLGCATGVWGM